MKSKKTLRAFMAMAMSSALISGTAMATTSNAVGGDTITFSGAVSDTTCNVTTGHGNDFTINLDPITSTQVGTTSGVITDGATAFTMAVSGCEGYTASNSAAQTLDIAFTGSNVSDDETYLKNAIGTASGVGIAITSDSATPVALNTALSTGLTTTGDSDSGNHDAQGDITYYANYYNYGGANISTGSVITTATCTFSYE